MNIYTTIKVSPSSTAWFVFLHEAAEVNLEVFKSILDKYTKDYEIFVGKALTDKDSSIIHHFDSSGLAYPDFKAGFLLSKQLVESLSRHFEENPDQLKEFPKDFSIDASYELAKGVFFTKMSCMLVHLKLRRSSNYKSVLTSVDVYWVYMNGDMVK